MEVSPNDDKGVIEKYGTRQRSVFLGCDRRVGNFQHNRTRSGDSFKKLEESLFTIFFDSLPSSMSKAWLYQIFNLEGKVVDIYISRKVRKISTQSFAFVRYKSREEALRAVRNLDGVEIRGNLMVVKEAEFKRVSPNDAIQDRNDPLV